MKKEQSEEFIKLINVWKNGKTIEHRQTNTSKTWTEIPDQTNISWTDPIERYRIKPEPRLVPFTFEDRELLKGKWITGRVSKTFEAQIVSISLEGVVLGNANGANFTMFLERYNFLDGTRCGKEIME